MPKRTSCLSNELSGREEKMSQEIDEKVTELDGDLNRYRREFKWGQFRWSALHHGALFGGPFLAFLTTLAVSIGWSQVWKSIFAAATMLLTSLSTAGAFREKWRVNRHARSEVDDLLIQLHDSNRDEEKIRLELRRVVKEEDKGILNAEDQGGGGPKTSGDTKADAET